ncbi:hypothetical protein D3C76_1206200 [compost metagenome]
MPVNPSTVISLWLFRVTSPPDCRVPAAFMAMALPLRVLAPLPPVICPLLVKMPYAVRLTLCPCRVPWLVNAPWLLRFRLWPAAITFWLVKAFTSCSVRLPNATTWPRWSKSPLLSSKSPPLNIFPVS